MITVTPRSGVLDDVLLSADAARTLGVSIAALDYFETRSQLHPVRVRSGAKLLRLFVRSEIEALALERAARKARGRSTR